MAVRRVPDKPLTYHTVKVHYLDGSSDDARAEGNNVAWYCKCDDQLPLLGRCYYQFGWNNHSICPTCNRRYRVLQTPHKKVREVKEIP